ncbi:BTB domain-containing protein [Mycena chlorophos]|uniref:BTB domain-containing protein n=1 Tax=Mycena chlorophos TaxID=658473 RepID=A0A8H6W292_MYCCL|nr:BTB domain-containing protein [Mycena chlorophos]
MVSLSDDATRCPSLWFPDGTLVIRAERTLFRVYAGLLARESPVFADMLAFPQHETEMERVEGCPVVELYDDSADEVRCFLEAVFDYRTFLPPPTRTTWPILTSILRLSRKYQVDDLTQRAMQHLSTAFPHKLELYPAANPSFDVDIPGLKAIIRVCRDLCVDWVLPAACYQLCAMAGDVAAITGGDVDADGNYLIDADARGHAPADPHCTPSRHVPEHDHHTLSPFDTTLLGTQHTLLRAETGAKMSAFLHSPPIARAIPGCPSPKQCVQTRANLRAQVDASLCVSTADGTESKSNAFSLALWDGSDWDRLNVCGVCLDVLRYRHKDEVQEFWRGLPARFDVGGGGGGGSGAGWARLRRERRRDLGEREVGFVEWLGMSV